MPLYEKKCNLPLPFHSILMIRKHNISYSSISIIAWMKVFLSSGVTVAPSRSILSIFVNTFSLKNLNCGSPRILNKIRRLLVESNTSSKKLVELSISLTVCTISVFNALWVMNEMNFHRLWWFRLKTNYS